MTAENRIIGIPRRPLADLLFNNPASHYIFGKSEKIASYSFIAGHLGMALKEGFVLNLEGGAGLSWLGAAAAMRFAKINPVRAFRTAAMFGIAGAAMVSASGINFETMQIVDPYKVITPLLSYVPANMLMYFQDELPKMKQKLSGSKNVLLNAFSKVCEYPIVTCALLGTIGVGGLAASAFNSGDIKLGVIALVYLAAHTGLGASDPRLQNEFKKTRLREHSGLNIFSKG